MDNFKSIVPSAVQTKIKELIELVNHDLRALVGSRGESVSECRVEPIEGNHVSGWIPSQDGGFYCSEFVRCDEDSTYHYTTKQTEYMAKQAKDCYHQFCDDNGIGYHDDLTEEQKESLSDYEREWFDPADLQLQAFAEGFDGRHPQITMRLSVNYKDSPYYREKYAEDIKVLALDVAEFLAMPVNEIISQLSKGQTQ